MGELKNCRSCFTDKPVLSFHKKGEYPDGRYPRCIDCVKNKIYIPPDLSSLISGKKVCTLCNVEKVLGDFNKRSNRINSFTSRCKLCINSSPKNRNMVKLKNRELEKTYGISLEDYNNMLANQNNTCKICNINHNTLVNKKKKYFCVDHNHITGKVRGLLCDSCNRGLGFLKDSKEVLLKAVEYLEMYE